MLVRQTRQALVQSLWARYRQHSVQMQSIETALQQKGMKHFVLDHFAIIDLPGPHTGIPHLCELFTKLGYIERGKGYLPDKQNDFLWMAEKETMQQAATDALPQVVVADFRLSELPQPIRAIIEKYANMAPAIPWMQIDQLVAQLEQGDQSAQTTLHDLLFNYLTQRAWPLPSLHEFNTVHAFNQLLAWVLVFGRQPNHFTISLHHLSLFNSIDDFHQFVEQDLKLPLNSEGGKIKGTPHTGIMQGSTNGQAETICLADGNVTLPKGFVEFAWRFANAAVQSPVLWQDYFTGFVAQHADHVIESLTNS